VLICSAALSSKKTLFCGADFRHEFSTLSEGNLEIVDEMGVVADEEATVEVADGSHVRDITVKSEEINGSYVAVVQLDNGLTQVRWSALLINNSCSRCLLLLFTGHWHGLEHRCHFEHLYLLGCVHGRRFTPSMNLGRFVHRPCLRV